MTDHSTWSYENPSSIEHPKKHVSIDDPHGYNTEWKQVEDGTDWAKCPNRRFEDWTEKAVFYFWEEPESTNINKACPVLQEFFESPDYTPKPPLEDAFGEPLEIIVDETLRNVMIGHQMLSVSNRCHVCDHAPFWCCRDCRVMLCMDCANEST